MCIFILRTLPISLAVLALLAPAASADTDVCTVDVGHGAGFCIQEYEFSSGHPDGCEQEGSYHTGVDSVTVWGPSNLVVVGVTGWTQCNHPEEGGFGLGRMSMHGFSVGAYAPESHATVGWSENTMWADDGTAFHECNFWAAVFVASERGGVISSCPEGVSPPHPAWGSLLP